MIPKEFWERFKTGVIAVECKTEDEKNEFFKQFDVRGNKITGFNSVNGICYYNGNEMFDYEKSLDCIYQELNKTYCVIKYSKDKCVNKYIYQLVPYSETNKSIKEENRMQFSPNGYSYRGQVFRDIEDYARYILKCKDNDRVKAEKERQEKLRDEKAKRTEELDKAYVEYFETCTEAKEKYLKTMEQYCKDYNIIIQNTNSKTYSPCKIYDIIDEIVFGK